MSRMCLAGFLGMVMVVTAEAHFPFIVPDHAGPLAKVVFSDDLNADSKVNLEKIADTKLTLRDSDGKESAIEWKKDDGFYSITLPGTDTRVVYGTTIYGVLQKGDSKPFKLVYYPKAIFGVPNVSEIGAKLPLEIVAVVTNGKIKFQVFSLAKPVGDVEVTVLLPEAGKKSMKTDSDGFTAEFDAGGRYGVTAKLVETISGEHAGKKYDEIRNYATLVCDYTK
jgi:hypothetical protein